MKKVRNIRFIVILAAALIVSLVIAAAQIKSASTAQPKATIAGMKVGGPFTLTDHTGKTFTENDLKGHYALIYFGFTYCPAICPTELQKINVALTQAGSKADKILPIFITVDPERDTKDHLAAYVAQFNPRLIGLTGTVEQVKQALDVYHIYARKVTDPALGDYTMDHSSYIYFLDPDGALIGLYTMESKASEIAEAIKHTVNP